MIQFLKSLILFLFFCSSVYAEDLEDISQIDITLSAECEPLTTIANCVNLSSGHFFQVEDDLVTNTIDPLHLTRYYDSSNKNVSFIGCGFGSQFPLFATTIQDGARHCYAMISEREGVFIPYRCRADQRQKTFKIDPRVLEKGYTNQNRSVTSGHANFVNWKAFYQLDQSETSWTVQLGDGSKRIYNRLTSLDTINSVSLGIPTKNVYLLKEEIKANGNHVYFDYELIHKKPLLSKIWTTNQTGDIILNQFDISYESGKCILKSSCGSQIDYLQSTLSYPLSLRGIVKLDKTVLNEVHSSKHGHIVYKKKTDCPLGQVIRIEKPDNYFLDIKYDSHYKVKSLHAPVGANHKPIPIYQFEYRKDSTKVWDALDQLTVYHFDSNQHLSCIDEYSENNQIIRQKKFTWNDKDGQEGWLKSKSIQLHDEIFYLKDCDYDSRGNILQETVYGNLTGGKPDSFRLEQKEMMDSYSIHYEYSSDERNLVISKKTPEGLTIRYDYLPGTNLCTQELHIYKSGLNDAVRIQERIFKEYDINGQIKKIIEDNGSSQIPSDLSNVTYRKVKTIHTVTDSSKVCFGKPEEIIEECFDSNQKSMVLLNRTLLKYDRRGNAIKQIVYDSQNTCLYEIKKKYDEKDRLIKETDALGYVTHYAYNENNNKIEEEREGLFKIVYSYDAVNRLVRKTQVDSDGKKTINIYSYDVLNQLTQRKVCYGSDTNHAEETNYRFDRFGNEIECTKSWMQDSHHTSIRPSTNITYNLLGHSTSKKDENGFTTSFSRNVYGYPTVITHPDGSVERFVYYPNGLLKQKWNCDGSSVCYIYNPKGRLLKESFYDTHGYKLKEECFDYEGPLLKFKKDAAGLEIKYSYDGSGYKIREDYCFEDNAIYQSENYQTILAIDPSQLPYSRSLRPRKKPEDPVEPAKTIEQEIKELLEQVPSSRRVKPVKPLPIQPQEKEIPRQIPKEIPVKEISNPIVLCGQLQKSVQFKYDDFGRMILISYDIDEQQAQLEAYQYDAKDRVTSKTLKDLQGKVYAHEEYQYDSQGNCTKKTVQQLGDVQAKYHFSYYVDGKLKWKEDPLGNRTWYSYDYSFLNGLSQQVERKLIRNPLGRVTIEEKDAFHRIVKKEEYEGDKQVSCTHYFYDAKGNLTKEQAFVKVDGQPLREYTIERSYNSRDLLTSETEKPYGKTTSYIYDVMGRLSHKKKPDGICLDYQYDRLGRVRKFSSSDGSVAYTYKYDLHDNPIRIHDQVHGILQLRCFDLLNRLVKDELFSGFAIFYSYDQLGRVIKMTLPNRSSIIYTYNPFHLTKVQRIKQIGQIDYECECKNYDLRGHVLKESSPAGEINYSFDLLGRCIAVKASQWNTSSDQFDAVGNLLSSTRIDPNGRVDAQFGYDSQNHLISESEANHQYKYDSIGNCLQKNSKPREINALNQIIQDEANRYCYDANGNLTNSAWTDYKYDALNRLTSIKQGDAETTFIYDAFGRCLRIQNNTEIKLLMYQKEMEIGSFVNGKIEDFRLMHPSVKSEKCFAIELQDEVFFPIQDYRYNICALQRRDGSLAKWYRYSAFGEIEEGGIESISSPWSFANRRAVNGLLLFTHRFYNPIIMRWQTADPLGFKDGLNLYAYVHNNPFYYLDRDGQFAFVIPLFTIGFEVAALSFALPTIKVIATAAAVGAIGFAAHRLNQWAEHRYNQELVEELECKEEETEKKEKFRFPENPDDLLPELPRDGKGRIQTADNLRIRPEQHPIKEGDDYNPRHHDQHYHIETRRDPNNPKWDHENKEIIKPSGYVPGMGTGFLPGEIFPGVY